MKFVRQIKRSYRSLAAALTSLFAAEFVCLAAMIRE